MPQQSQRLITLCGKLPDQPAWVEHIETTFPFRPSYTEVRNYEKRLARERAATYPIHIMSIYDYSPTNDRRPITVGVCSPLGFVPQPLIGIPPRSHSDVQELTRQLSANSQVGPGCRILYLRPSGQVRSEPATRPSPTSYCVSYVRRFANGDWSANTSVVLAEHCYSRDEAPRYFAQQLERIPRQQSAAPIAPVDITGWIELSDHPEQLLLNNAMEYRNRQN